MTKTRIVFVHGLDRYGAAAWPRQHLLAGHYDALFLKRTGFDAVDPAMATDFTADARMVIDALGDGGHVVAHAQGAISAMMAAVDRPDLVKSMVLLEPAVLSLSAELPASAAYRESLEPLFARRDSLTDAEFLADYRRLGGAMEVPSPDGSQASLGMAGTTGSEAVARLAARTHLQRPSWEAPLHIVPGVPTLVVTGGWEPLFEEIAAYLATTGARHEITRGGHRPQDTSDGAALIAQFISQVDGE